MNVIAISTARNMLNKESRDYLRMKKYASKLGVFHVVLITYEGEHDEIADDTLRIHPTNSGSKVAAFFDAITIGRNILQRHKEKDFVITSQDPFELSIIGLILSRAKNAMHQVQIHGDFFGSHFWRSESLMNRFRYLLGLFVVRRTHCIRVVSERIKRSLVARGVSPSHIVVLPIRPELERFFENTPEDKEHTTLRILTVGRLASEKNIPMLLRAYKKIAKDHQNVRLKIVGSGPEEKKLKAMAASMKIKEKIDFMPWTEDIAGEMRNADISVLTSNHEGYALVLVEAMASGLPIITTDVGCVGDVVKDGVHGYTIPVGNDAALSNALLKLIEHPEVRKQFGRNGREKATQIMQTSEEAYIQALVASFSCAKKGI